MIRMPQQADRHNRREDEPGYIRWLRGSELLWRGRGSGWRANSIFNPDLCCKFATQARTERVFQGGSAISSFATVMVMAIILWLLGRGQKAVVLSSASLSTGRLAHRHSMMVVSI